MKNITKIGIFFVLVLIMAGCSNNDGGRTGVGNSNSVDKVINDQIDNSDKTTNNADTQSMVLEDTSDTQSMVTENASDTQSTVPEDDSDTDVSQELSEKTTAEAAGSVDYDLTAMSSDMVYATVYQMMIDPEAYIGKTFRMDGLYYATYYEPTAQYYHYCIIKDATACCAQGLEFVWDDGSHVYPDEYPEDNTEIIVEGTFETYREDGDYILYCRLKDATLEVK